MTEIGVFTGRYAHKLDAKNRLFIPAKYREHLGDTFYVVQGLKRRNLRIYTSEGWLKVLNMIEEKGGDQKEMLNRLLNSNAVEASPDDQGRILLTPFLVDHAKIKKEAVVLGCGKYVEIWASEEYDEFLKTENSTVSESLAALLGM